MVNEGFFEGVAIIAERRNGGVGFLMVFRGWDVGTAGHDEAIEFLEIGIDHGDAAFTNSEVNFFEYFPRFYLCGSANNFCMTHH